MSGPCREQQQRARDEGQPFVLPERAVQAREELRETIESRTPLLQGAHQPLALPISMAHLDWPCSRFRCMCSSTPTIREAAVQK